MRLRGVATGLQVSGASIAAFVGLWLAPMTGGLVRAETPEAQPGRPDRPWQSRLVRCRNERRSACE